MLKSPKYCIVGLRPVKAEKTADGGLAIYAFNWETGAFELNIRYLEHLYGFYTGDLDIKNHTKEEFDKYVSDLRKKRGFE